MLFYDRISESQSIVANRTDLDTPKEWNICHFYFLKDINFLYEHHACNGWHSALLHAISLRDFNNISVKGNTCRVVRNLLYN